MIRKSTPILYVYPFLVGALDDEYVAVVYIYVLGYIYLHGING